MNPATRERLETARERHEELTRLLAEPEVIGDHNRYARLSREYSELDDLITTWRALEQAERARDEARGLLDDEDMREMAREEITAAEARIETLSADLRRQMLPADPNDRRNLFLEIRAGTGGHEAALFAGDLYRMYARYIEKQGWRMEILSVQEAEHGGYRELVARVIGEGAYSRLKFESGTHRVQRVPATESQGRIHTSACTVAILPEAEDIDDIAVDPNDLRIDTFRSSGAGGQHVNTTDSAIRITHLPSGIVVECQDERSQHKNRARAMSLLQARLMDAEQTRRAAEQAAERKSQVGSGDRSERIRTYNFPQGRVTDHRIGLTLYQLDDVLDGGLEAVIEPLTEARQAELLENL